MRTPRTRLILTAAALIITSACSNNLDADEATAIFSDCLARNGIEAGNVDITLDSSGTIDSLSVVVLGEGDVAYEPTIRLACTEEVENR